MKNYRVCGVTKKGGDVAWSFDVSAENANDAKAIALCEWNAICLDAHLFRVTAKRVIELNDYKNIWVRNKIIY